MTTLGTEYGVRSASMTDRIMVFRFCYLLVRSLERVFVRGVV